MSIDPKSLSSCGHQPGEEDILDMVAINRAIPGPDKNRV